MLRTTILITDLTGAHAAGEDLRAEHARLLCDAVTESGACSASVKQSDAGLIAVFEQPGGAVDCAVCMQRAVQLHNHRHPQRHLAVRVGLHIGGLAGSSVAVAQRLCDRAETGQILAALPVWSRAGLLQRLRPLEPLHLPDGTPLPAVEVLREPEPQTLEPATAVVLGRRLP